MSSWKKMKAMRAKEKEAAKEAPPTASIINRGEIEAERVRLYHEEQRVAEEQKEAKRKTWAAAASAHGATSQVPTGNTVAFMPQKEIIRRLRDRGQPATLFGEDDDDRKARLQELIAKEVVLDDMGDSGFSHQKELMKKAIEETLATNKQRLESGITPEQAAEDERKRVEGVIKEKEEELAGKREKMGAIDVATPSDRTIPNNIVAITEARTYVLLFVECALLEWNLLLLRRTPEEKKAPSGHRETTRYEETSSYMKPLTKLLAKQTLSEALTRPFLQMSFYGLAKEYVQAMDVYQGMAVGNAQWPLGVTQVCFCAFFFDKTTCCQF